MPAGALLFAVAELDPVWIKVPVYVGDVDRLALDSPAGVGSLADPPGVKVRPARPVIAPPSGDPLAATVHLFYEADNKDRHFRPGQRVGVTLPLKGDEESLAVPRSALIRDALGGTWVYENISPHVYTRRRVFVDRVVGDLAALTGGLKPGARSSRRRPPSSMERSSGDRSSMVSGQWRQELFGLPSGLATPPSFQEIPTR